jgi:CMP-N-acetylneuraminic acid synthetase
MISGKPRKISSILNFNDVEKMNLLVTICARGGSKGIPGKNIRPLAGKPLIGYTIDTARAFASGLNGDVVLSTDDEDIRAIASGFGLETGYQRPEHLATDAAGKIDTISDLLLFHEAASGKTYDYILDLDVTSPLRTQEDLQKALGIIRSDERAVNLFSVNAAARNPYFNMVEVQENGYYGTVKKGSFLTRQSAPKVYDMNASFYFYRRRFFSEGYRSAITDRSLIYEMPHICFDLDHPVDFEFLSFLLEQNKLDFSL